MNALPNITDSRDGLYMVHAEDGQLMAYAARVTEYDDGRLYWFAGSASGPVLGHIALVSVGTRFTHWQWGLCEVEKINRKTIRLAVLDAASECKMSERLLNV